MLGYAMFSPQRSQPTFFSEAAVLEYIKGLMPSGSNNMHENSSKRVTLKGRYTRHSGKMKSVSVSAINI